MAYKIKKGDVVEVIAGKDKGRQGKVLVVDHDKQRISVEGVNRIKRHTKPNKQNPNGGILEKEGTIHYSNVLLVDPKTSKGGRVHFANKGKGKDKLRVFAKTGSELKS